MGKVKTLTTFQSANKPQKLNFDFIDIMISNRGAATAYINNFPLRPVSATFAGDVFTLSANQNEFIAGNFDLTFDPAAAVADCSVFIVWRYYA